MFQVPAKTDLLFIGKNTDWIYLPTFMVTSIALREEDVTVLHVPGWLRSQGAPYTVVSVREGRYVIPPWELTNEGSAISVVY